MEILTRYRNDARYAMFSIWSDVRHQDIALQIIEIRIKLQTADDEIRDDELYDAYDYVFNETHYVCGRCKTAVHDFDSEGVYDIALDPSILFEGDVLVCYRCTKEELRNFKKTDTKPRVCTYAIAPENTPKYRFEWRIPTHPWIYNVMHDYYTVMLSAIRMRNSFYSLSLIQPYHNFREMTLFELLRKKTIDYKNLKVK